MYECICMIVVMVQLVLGRVSVGKWGPSTSTLNQKITSQVEGATLTTRYPPILLVWSPTLIFQVAE